MKRRLTAPLTALMTATFVLTWAVAAAPTPPAPATTAPAPVAVPAPAPEVIANGPLTRQRLQNGLYAVLPPVIQGNPNLVSGSDMASIVASMVRDSQGAIKRHYPAANFTSDTNAAGVIRVTPQMVTPSALVPWANIGAAWVIQSAGNPDLVLKQDFSLWAVYLHRADAANFVFDQLAQRLP